jgi:hypothetical protein
MVPSANSDTRNPEFPSSLYFIFVFPFLVVMYCSAQPGIILTCFFFLACRFGEAIRVVEG